MIKSVKAVHDNVENRFLSKGTFYPSYYKGRAGQGAVSGAGTVCSPPSFSFSNIFTNHFHIPFMSAYSGIFVLSKWQQHSL